MWSWLPNFEPTVNSSELTKTIPNWPSWRFPRIPPVTGFPALGSCHRSQVFPRLALGIFPRLLQATSFPGLASRFAFCFGFVCCAFYRRSDPWLLRLNFNRVDYKTAVELTCNLANCSYVPSFTFRSCVYYWQPFTFLSVHIQQIESIGSVFILFFPFCCFSQSGTKRLSM